MGPGPPAPAIKPKSRLTRSRLARALLTSIATVTPLATSSSVVVATSSTGSLQPWDWTRVSLSGAASRYQACDHQTGGPGAIWCMLSSGFRPASAAGPHANAYRSQPVFSLATIQDSAPASQAPTARPGSRPVSARGSTQGVPSGTQLVHVPRNATREDVYTACRTAMKTAQSQGSAAMNEAEAECQSYYGSYCQAATKPLQAQGVAAIHEMGRDCSATQQAQPGA